MNKEIKENWTRGLRSGEFKQGMRGLYVNNKYCVLGVLCMLAMLEGVCDIEESPSGVFKFDGKAANLPLSVQIWAGIKSANGTIPNEFLSLSGYNDVGEYDFLQLADMIDSKWEEL